ncbi:MAG: glycosyltransferase [Actinomycetaceae bacterium]|nr:glycosyltransferase [Actinomycetaceae bacterium]
MVRIVVDQAGSPHGGAGRFRRELVDYTQRAHESLFQVIGLHTFLTPQWLAEREVRAAGASQKIALNNASFVAPGGEKTVVLQNVIHFSNRAEQKSIGYSPSLRMRLQVPIIRAGALRADRIIVPTTEMLKRVSRALPSTQNRIEVKALPLSPPAWIGTEPKEETVILLPQTPQRYKPLAFHVQRLHDAIELVGKDATIICTCNPEELPKVALLPRVTCIGRQTHEQMDAWYGRAQAVYFPTTYESFGYPVAEARAGGRWLLGQDTEQNREIAGRALLGYDVTDIESLAEAVSQIGDPQPQPEPEPFDPERFFNDVIFGNSNLQAH